MRLQIDDLVFGYTSQRPVLNGLSLQWSAESVLSILGANGCGKSTLLQCIAAQLHPQHGRVSIDGRAVVDYRPRQLAAKVAYLPQTHQPVFAFRVLDVVLMGRTARRGMLATPGTVDEDAARECLGFLGVEDLAERPYTSISGGERQLVLLASAIAQEPEVLLLDEPTSHLDFGNSHLFLRLVRRLGDRGIGVIMTSHFPDHTLALNGHAAVLRDGRVSAYGPARAVLTEDCLSDLYGIPVQVVEVGEQIVCIAGEDQ